VSEREREREREEEREGEREREKLIAFVLFLQSARRDYYFHKHFRRVAVITTKGYEGYPADRGRGDGQS